MDGDCLVGAVGLVLFCVIFYYLKRPHLEKEARRARERRDWQDRVIDGFTSDQDFEWTRRFVHRDTGTGIAVDKTRGKLCLFYFKSPGQEHRKLLEGSSIVQVDVVEDGSSVLTTRKTGTVGRAIAGGVLLGATGAIVGATSAGSETTVTETVRSLELHLLVDDLDVPTYRVVFLKGRYKKDSEPYRTAMQRVQYYHSAIQVLMHRGARNLEVSSASTDGPQEQRSLPKPRLELATQSEQGTSQLDGIETAKPNPSPQRDGVSDAAGAAPDQQEKRHKDQPSLHPDGHVLAEEVAASLQQINEHILEGRGVVREAAGRVCLRWKATGTGLDRIIRVVYLNQEQVSINGEICPADLSEIQRRLAACLGAAFSTQP